MDNWVEIVVAIYLLGMILYYLYTKYTKLDQEEISWTFAILLTRGM